MTALPSWKEFTIGAKDEFLVLACDGLWNVMDSQEVVDMVRKEMDEVEMDYADRLASSLEGGGGGGGGGGNGTPSSAGANGVGGPPDSCAVVSERVARMALRLGSHDNITVVIVRL